MKKYFLFTWLFLLGMAAPEARADLGYWSSALVGKWRHPKNGDVYEFKSNATYTFRAGAAKRRAGNLAHSGRWKIVSPTEKESGGSMEGPVALSLMATSRTVSQGKKSRVLPSNRRFRIVVDVAKLEENTTDENNYWIGEVKWKRVR